MEFILNEYHRNISDEELLSDIIAIATKLQKETVSREEYSKYGKFGRTTIERHFGSWTKALNRAGLKTQQEFNNSCTSLDNFIEDVKRVVKQLGKNTLTTGDYKRYGKYYYSYPKTNYNKSWNEVLKIAGLESTPFRLGKGKEISQEELFDDIERVWIKLGRQPTITDLKSGHFKFSQNTFVRRFGGWRNTLIAFVNYINSEDTFSNNTKDCIIEESVSNKQIIHHRTKRDPNQRLRFLVMQRDNFKCCLCGRSPATDPVQLVVDHIYPWAQGGETTYENLQTLCRECNSGKSDLICDNLLQ